MKVIKGFWGFGVGYIYWLEWALACVVEQSDVLIFQELWFRQITSAIGVGKVLYLIVGFKIAKQVVIVVLKARCVSYY